MGRAGRWFAIEDEDVVPDIVTSAKSLGGGMPISAITGRADLMDAVHVGGLGGTYGGNPVAAAAALAVLDKIEREDLLTAARRTGETVMRRFGEMRARHAVVGDVRGRGAMCALELVADRSTKEPLAADPMGAIARGALERGVDRAPGRHLRQRGAAAPADQHRRGAPRGRPQHARRGDRGGRLLSVPRLGGPEPVPGPPSASGPQRSGLACYRRRHVVPGGVEVQPVPIEHHPSRRRPDAAADLAGLPRCCGSGSWSASSASSSRWSPPTSRSRGSPARRRRSG